MNAAKMTVLSGLGKKNGLGRLETHVIGGEIVKLQVK